MAAGAVEQLIRAVQRMAVDAPELKEIRSLLGTINKRGNLSATGVAIDPYYQDERETCCEEGSENDTPVDPDAPTVNPWTGSEPPPEYADAGDDVTDCETGESVDMTFTGGFTQAETCKECGPDETWYDGWYWVIDALGQPPGPSPSANTCCNNWVDQISGTGWFVSRVEVLGEIPNLGGRCWYANESNPNSESFVFMDTLTCTSTQYDSGVCTLEPPEECGPDWDSDGTKQLTIRNGCIVASKCDPDAATGDLGCREEVTLCKGGVAWTFKATSDGGWVQYDKTGTRKGGKYNEARQRTDILDAGSTGGY